MSEYCLQCTVKILGLAPELNDFRHKIPEGQFIQVLCEGCGTIIVNHEGRCQGTPYSNRPCDQGHTKHARFQLPYDVDIPELRKYASHDNANWILRNVEINNSPHMSKVVKRIVTEWKKEQGYA